MKCRYNELNDFHFITSLLQQSVQSECGILPPLSPPLTVIKWPFLHPLALRVLLLGLSCIFRYDDGTSVTVEHRKVPEPEPQQGQQATTDI